MWKTTSFLSLSSCLLEYLLWFSYVSMFPFCFNFHVLLAIPPQSSHKSKSLVGCPSYSMAWYGKCLLCMICASLHTLIPHSGVPGLTELVIQYLIQPWWGALLLQYGLLFSAGNDAIWSLSFYVQFFCPPLMTRLLWRLRPVQKLPFITVLLSLAPS